MNALKIVGFFLAVTVVLALAEFLVTNVPEPLLLIGTGLGVSLLIRSVVKAGKN